MKFKTFFPVHFKIILICRLKTSLRHRIGAQQICSGWNNESQRPPIDNNTQTMNDGNKSLIYCYNFIPNVFKHILFVISQTKIIQHYGFIWEV